MKLMASSRCRGFSVHESALRANARCYARLVEELNEFVWPHEYSAWAMTAPVSGDGGACPRWPADASEAIGGVKGAHVSGGGGGEFGAEVDPKPGMLRMISAFRDGKWRGGRHTSTRQLSVAPQV
jgi:hypothetical protein